MPWFIVRLGRLPVADEQPFPTQEAPGAAALRRYPTTDCYLIEAQNTIAALREVIDRPRPRPGTTTG